MIIRSAEFMMSNTDYQKCPDPKLPEFAFIGRSNVGKSSLINMLVERKGMAKVSGTPGKTQTINHFVINKQWYLVDLPGYGFARLSRESRWQFGQMIEGYLKNRENLLCTFILLDARLPLQSNDLDFINWMGQQSLATAIVLTKADKLKQAELAQSVQQIEAGLLTYWEELPPFFVTSAEKRTGRDQVLDFITQSMPAGRK